MRVFKRNDVVFVGCFYGRIVRKIDDEHYEVVCAGQHWTTWHVDDIKPSPEYKGYWQYKTKWWLPVIGDVDRSELQFVKMPTLRRLKQRASRYYPNMWYRKRS